MDLNSNVDWEKYKEDFKAVQYYYKKNTNTVSTCYEKSICF